MLPALEKAGIDYWVWGGIGIAGAKKVFREEISNNDVDVIVKDSDWEKSKILLRQLAFELGLEYRESEKYSDSFKIELIYKGKEIFSAVPVFAKDDHVDFRYGQKFPLDFLEPELREVDRYKFPTLKDKYLKELFICYFEHNLNKKGSKYWQKHMIDAQGFLSEEQIQKFQ